LQEECRQRSTTRRRADWSIYDENDDGDKYDETGTRIALFMPTTTTRVNEENFGSFTPLKASADVRFAHAEMRFGVGKRSFLRHQ